MHSIKPQIVFTTESLLKLPFEITSNIRCTETGTGLELFGIPVYYTTLDVFNLIDKQIAANHDGRKH